MEDRTGLRERKKLQTRRAIAEAARRLFAERGFEAVTVAEVAAAADVSPATVFNYFRTKEDLFYSGMEAFEAELLGAVRARAPGESALDAFRTVIVAGSARLADESTGDVVARAAATVSASPALQVRELELHERCAVALAELLAEEISRHRGETEARAAAGALVAAHRAVLTRIREEALAGRRGRKLAQVAKAEANAAFGRLEAGLGDYAVRRGVRRSSSPSTIR